MADESVVSMPGFRSFTRPPLQGAWAADDFAALSPTDLSDAQFGLGAVDGGIRSLSADSGRFAGPALTVSVTPGNGLMIRKALELARPGDILVISAFGNRERALFGANVASNMVKAGLRAVVVDGVIRDLAGITAIGLPVFARGVTPRSGSDRNGRGEINVPVACGGVVVAPNDIVVADCQDGIAVVPGDEWALVASRARTFLSPEAGARRVLATTTTAVQAGEATLDDALAEAGFQSMDRSWVADRFAREEPSASR